MSGVTNMVSHITHSVAFTTVTSIDPKVLVATPTTAIVAVSTDPKFAKANAAAQAAFSQGHVFRRSSIIIHHRDETFVPEPTFLDEASVLHALHGEHANNALYLRNARAAFVGKLKKQIQNPSVQKALRKLMGIYRLHYNTETFGPKVDIAYCKNARLLHANSLLDAGEKYSAACMNRSYCFTQFDLEMIAIIFQTTIYVYSDIDRLKYSVGHNFKAQIVLFEDSIGLYSEKTFPCYQRCVEQGYFAQAKAWKDWLFNNVIDTTSPLAKDVLFLYESLPSALSDELKDVILGFTNTQIKINRAMHDILAKEKWSTSIQSVHNYRFIQKFQRKVTQIYNGNRWSKMQGIVSSRIFPHLRSISFDNWNSQTLQSYSKILAENPGIRALKLDGFSFADLDALFTALPEIADKLEDLQILDLITEKTWRVLKKCISLRNIRIFARSTLTNAEETFNSIVAQFPQIRHIDIYGMMALPFDTIKGFIYERRHGLKSIDLRVNNRGTGVNSQVNDNDGIDVESLNNVDGLSIFSALSDSNLTFIPFLATIDSMTELNISGVKLQKPDEIRSLINSKALKVFKMRLSCDSLSHVSSLAQLIDLDITYSYFQFDAIPLLGNLTRLQVLRWGGFVVKIIGKTGDYCEEKPHSEETAKFITELSLTLPQSCILDTKPLLVRRWQVSVGTPDLLP